jgi:glycosyltransferase involved in cell wall biosynthesis
LIICFFSHSAQLSGAERSLLELVAELTADHGAVCTVVLPGPGPLAEALREAGAGIVQSSYSGWCLRATERSSADTDLRLRQEAATLVESVLPQLAALDLDVIVTQTLVVPWGAAAAALLGVPHVWSVCEYGDEAHGLRFLHDFEKILRDVERSSAYVFTPSAQMVDELFGHLPDDRRGVLYRHIAVPRQFIEAGPTGLFRRPGAIRLGLFGTICEGKGQEDAIRAVARLAAEGRDVELLLAGYADASYWPKVEGLIRQLDASDRVTSAGFLPDPFPAMRDSDILLACSRREGFGRSAVEAMLLGKPVVYASAGVFLEHLSDGITGLGYEPGNHASLAACIAALIDHPERRAQLGIAARQSAEAKFTREAYGGRFYRTVAESLRRGAAPASMPTLVQGVVRAAVRERLGRPPGDPARVQTLESALATAVAVLRESDRMNAAGRLGAWLARLRHGRPRYVHQWEHGVILASGEFEAQWYLQQYPDVAAAGADPLQHFVHTGARERRKPNPRFDTEGYVRDRPEVARDGVNPFVHYLLHRTSARET